LYFSFLLLLLLLFESFRPFRDQMSEGIKAESVPEKKQEKHLQKKEK
jgi:hypothetical protein